MGVRWQVEAAMALGPRGSTVAAFSWRRSHKRMGGLRWFMRQDEFNLNLDAPSELAKSAACDGRKEGRVRDPPRADGTRRFRWKQGVAASWGRRDLGSRWNRFFLTPSAWKLLQQGVEAAALLGRDRDVDLFVVLVRS